MFRLRSRIMLSFTLIIICGTLLMVFFVNITTRSGYQSFSQQNDIDMAESLSFPLAEFYRVNGSWDGVESLLQFPLNRTGTMREMMGRPGGQLNHPGGMLPQIILTDSSGYIIFKTDSHIENGKTRYSRDDLEKARKIVLNNRTVGFILAGTMIHKGLTNNERVFLNRTLTVIILVSLLILAASMVASWLLASRLSGPVSLMAKASRDVRNGDLTIKIPVEGRDELAQLSASFNEMVLALNKNDRWRKQIIADSAHELRTPVSLIQGNLEMILDGLYKADENRLKDIYNETLVLSRLIEELQLLSSAESGSMILNMEEIDLSELIGNGLRAFEAEAEKSSIDLRTNLEDPIPHIRGDYQKLKQVLSNVLANAFRHTPERGFINITARIKDREILISVEDSGPGIPDEDLEKIFERFYRTDSGRNRNYGGSGLGLAISREIIKLHGGSISAHSEKGKGGLIFISLPFKNT